MTAAEIILALVTAQRGGELLLSRAHTEALIERGAVEIAPEHYPFMVAVHAAWLISLWAFGYDQPIDIVALVIYLGLQALRVWVMVTLGARWTTRIIVPPNAPLVTSGPYQYLRHPNYVVVAGEIAILPLTLQLPAAAVIFSLLNAGVLYIRIRAEDQALDATKRTR